MEWWFAGDGGDCDGLMMVYGDFMVVYCDLVVVCGDFVVVHGV